jgi:molecular chaperone DnaJ
VPVAIPKDSAESETAEIKLGVPVEFDRRPQLLEPPEPLPQDAKDGRDYYQPKPVEGIWNCDACEETDSTRSSEGQRPAGPTTPVASEAGQRPVGPATAIAGEAIAYNLRGEPIIARSVSQDTGAGVTTVVNDDGTVCTFGQNTLASLMSSGEDDAASWVGSLTCLETRGLVHEIGQVLLSTSAVYQFHLDRLQSLSEKCHYEFFGLDEDATDAEIDRAYKKLAKQMHPDKNGGTEEAKEAFQQMKEKYEALKQRRAEGGDSPKRKKSKEKAEDGEGEIEDAEKGEDGKRKEAYDSDEDNDGAPKKKESGQISYDPTDQESLANTALEMLQRLKAIEGSMTTVQAQLKKHGL